MTTVGKLGCWHKHVVHKYNHIFVFCAVIRLIAFGFMSLLGFQLAAVQCDPDHLFAWHPVALCSISHSITIWTWGWGRWWKQRQQRNCGTGNEWLVINIKMCSVRFAWLMLFVIRNSSTYRKETLGSVNTLCQILLLLGRQLIHSPTPSTASFRPSLISWCLFLVEAHFSRWH